MSPQRRSGLGTNQEAIRRHNLGTVLRHHWAPTLAASAGVVSAFAIFYLSTAFTLSYLTAERDAAREAVLAVQLAANLFLALGIVLAAIGSDKVGAQRMLAWGAAFRAGGKRTVPVLVAAGEALTDSHEIVRFAASGPLRPSWNG